MGGDVDQGAVALDLQPADAVLVDERQEARVAVAADALPVAALGIAVASRSG